jgi:hypothetical protein
MPYEPLLVEASVFAAADDMREGTRAFVAKRTPAFKGR